MSRAQVAVRVVLLRALATIGCSSLYWSVGSGATSLAGVP